MFITRECDYAVRIVRALAPGERMAVKQICEAELIPQPYTYKILKKLEKEGLVQSFRGVYGGYTLSKPLGEITLFDVLIAVEDQLLLNECMKQGYECPRNGEEHECRVHSELWRIQDELVAQLKSRSMQEIL